MAAIMALQLATSLWLVTGLATELKLCFLVVLLRFLVVSSLNHTFTEWMLRFSEEAEDSRSLRPRFAVELRPNSHVNQYMVETWRHVFMYTFVYMWRQLQDTPYIPLAGVAIKFVINPLAGMPYGTGASAPVYPMVHPLPWCGVEFSGYFPCPLSVAASVLLPVIVLSVPRRLQYDSLSNKKQ